MSRGQAGGRGGAGWGAPRHQGGKGTFASAPSPALLTSFIKKAWTIDALFQTCSEHQSQLNHIHLSACWNKLGHLTRPEDTRWFEQHAQSLQSLGEHTMTVVSTSSDIRARELANIAHGVAKSGRGAAMGPLVQALATSMTPRLAILARASS